MFAAGHSTPAQPPVQVDDGVVKMQVVGQCLGDKRKHDDLVAAEICIATPVPSEKDDGDLVPQEENKDQDDQFATRFREALAKRRPTGRSQSAFN